MQYIACGISNYWVACGISNYWVSATVFSLHNPITQLHPLITTFLRQFSAKLIQYITALKCTATVTRWEEAGEIHPAPCYPDITSKSFRVATALLVAGVTCWYGKLTFQNHAKFLLSPCVYWGRLWLQPPAQLVSFKICAYLGIWLRLITINAHFNWLKSPLASYVGTQSKQNWTLYYSDSATMVEYISW